jgi:DNA-binding transcriptional MocR family regulator
VVVGGRHSGAAVRVTPKIAEAADAVRGMIAAGMLSPGDRAPSSEALREATGICTDYCRRALFVAEAQSPAGGGPANVPSPGRA